MALRDEDFQYDRGAMAKTAVSDGLSESKRSKTGSLLSGLPAFPTEQLNAVCELWGAHTHPGGRLIWSLGSEDMTPFGRHKSHTV